MTSKDSIMYTPDMYEYFFVEDNEESRTKKNKVKKPRQVSSTDLALAAIPSEAISWPEAYEFFFADGPQDLDKKGLMFSMPSQALSSADVLQHFVPDGLKAFSIRGTHHRRTTDTRLFSSQEGQEIFKETNLASALLANIGAVSAIRYLRRRSRRLRQESSPQPGDET
ncbi:PGC-1 and ERR-induced regulator in muscle protein 1 isoform X2 [Pseudophryne corroboree]|uniref:PGC-1 and ERR-induced regulator in muscle protein 1 isoform X2 n=1 Tax=Pseudophryne corroboree TaxID=495146 RepID=UPI003081B252